MTPDSNDEQVVNPGTWSGEEQSGIWRAFVAPQGDAEFCQAWLALLCRQLTGIKAGVVLFQSETNTFTPIAVWPDVTRDLSFLGTVAERALTEARGVVHYPEDSHDNPIHVGYPIEISKGMVGSVVLEVTPRSENDVQALLRQMHWGIAWLYDLAHRRELASAQVSTERIGTVMEALAATLRHKRLQQSLFELANYVTEKLKCARVVIGLPNKDHVGVKAFSNAAWFEKHANAVKRYAAAMDEAYDKLATIHYNRSEDQDSDAVDDRHSAHTILANESGAVSLLSIPLLQGAKCIGVITLERDSDELFDDRDIAWMDALAGVLPAVIEQRQQAERSYVARLREDVAALMSKLFGPRHLTWKFVAAVLVLTVSAFTFLDIDYRVTAKTIIEGETQRAIAVPYAGFVGKSYVRAGDVVKEGQILCVLDDRDLQLEKHKWESEVEQTNRKLREAMAKHDLATWQVLSAQVRQSEAQLSLVNEQLVRSKIKAPFDGVVISGDLSQLIGSPVEMGKTLFEVAPLEAYRVILQVDERELRHVQVGQPGKLVISGIVDDPIPFETIKITPVATAEDGSNFFRVEARLEQTNQNLRPGMEGIGKIEVGERNLWWVTTHSFTDWLRLSLWKWLP